MPKKIVVIEASPRKGGNSDILCDELIKGAVEKGKEIEKIYISDLKIGYCRACNECKSTGKCVQQDDMAVVLDQLVEADSIVLATPVYFYSMSGQLKVMLDRCFPRYAQMRNKEFVFIATAAADRESMERAVDSMKCFTDCLPGARVTHIIYGEGAWEMGEVRKRKAVEEAYQVGLQI